MSNTVNNSIPFVPENTIDPAAGLNESLLTVDALLQLAVVSVGDNAPPGSPANGARYVVGTAPTGAWAGRANQVAQRLDGGWRFYQARYALNLADGLMYVRQGATWGVAAAEWTAETVSQAEAEAGTATTRRAWTSLRVRQAILGWWNSATSAFGRGFVAAANAAAGRTALELGTAATATLTASTTDGTVGRVLKAGDFGIGGDAVALPGADMNTIVRTGAYVITGPGNAPVAGSTTNLFVLGNTSSSGRTMQLAQPVTSELYYVRSQSAGTWSAWRQLYHSGNLVPNVLTTYTLATLPSAAANPRLQVYCSNLTGQPAPVYSDGTNWRRVSDNTIAN